MNLQAMADLHGPIPRHNDETSQRRFTVCVDFDGVLNESKGPYQQGRIGPPIPAGMELLRWLSEHGFNIVVLTARKETDLVSQWLKAHGWDTLLVTNHKPPALAYIDDHAINFNGSNLKSILKKLKKHL